MSKPTVKKVTPIVTARALEPAIDFWTGRLGFEATVTVPHEDTIGFAILAKDGVEIMYQSKASIDADLGESGAPSDLGGELDGSTATLFIEVGTIDSVLESLGDAADVVVGRRQTFYGMDEIFVRAPCGTLVGFAAKVEGAADG